MNPFPPPFSKALAQRTANRILRLSRSNQVGLRDDGYSPSLPILAQLSWPICQKIVGKFSSIVQIYDLREQRTLYASGSLAEQLGYGDHEMRTRGDLALGTLIHPEDLGPIADYFQRLSSLQVGEIAEIQYRMERSSGGWCWIRSQETPYLPSIEGSSVRQIIGMIEIFPPESEAETDRPPEVTAVP